MEGVLRTELTTGDEVVHGGARGADTLAGLIAKRLGHSVKVYQADWATYHKAAGGVRNQQMLDSGVDWVIAFAGGRGTADMVRRAQKRGVPVLHLTGTISPLH